jgi:hypothetical protein
MELSQLERPMPWERRIMGSLSLDGIGEEEIEGDGAGKVTRSWRGAGRSGVERMMGL